jgi:hypothetical protein
MASFEEAWKAVSDTRHGKPSDQLREHLKPVYDCCVAEMVELKLLVASLDRLLAFLETEGRTSANCWATDLFFMDCTDWERDWADHGDDLPESLHDVLAMMGEAMHDTVDAPEVARNFGCLPEQLRARLRQTPSRLI